MAGGTEEGITVFQCVYIHALTPVAGDGGGKRVSFFWLKITYFQISPSYFCGEFKGRITGIADVIKTALRLACIGYIPRAANWTSNLDR